MPNEERINKLTAMFQELGSSISKGSVKVVPNNEVLDDSPADLPAGYIKVKDELGYTIPAITVANVIVVTGQFVNLLYVEGTEPIAFQQGSDGTTNVALWQLVGGTGPNIYYNNGNVSIGKVTSPDATLEILDTTTQLRLTHTDASKYADFAVDTSHNLTITPSSTGQIILQPTSDSTDFFQVLDADGGVPVLNVDSINERVGIGTNSPNSVLEIADNGTPVTVSPLIISGDTDTHILQITSNIATSGSPQLLRFVPIIDPTGVITNIFGININPQIGGSGSNNVTNVILAQTNLRLIASYGGTIVNLYNFFSSKPDITSSGSPAITTNYGYYCEDLTEASTNWAFYATGNTKSFFRGNVGIGQASIAAKLHVDQFSTTAAIPTITVDQADLSEEFINFISTIGAGNPIDTAAIGTYYGKARVAVNGTFKYVALYNS